MHRSHVGTSSSKHHTYLAGRCVVVSCHSLGTLYLGTGGREGQLACSTVMTKRGGLSSAYPRAFRCTFGAFHALNLSIEAVGGSREAVHRLCICHRRAKRSWSTRLDDTRSIGGTVKTARTWALSMGSLRASTAKVARNTRLRS